MVLVAIALAASAILNLYSLHETMMDDRKITLRYVVDQSTSIVQDYAERAKSGEMSEADAKAAALKTLASQRFDNNNYVFVTERDGTMAMHPLVPDLVGKSAASVKDP
ncbi:MAG TPA: methyl-accepting chemotaxis protein, partial [Thalassospira sp.]|nr:methyl-accepting chemotaxis protein [Thalassospira sp.]